MNCFIKILYFQVGEICEWECFHYLSIVYGLVPEKLKKDYNLKFYLQTQDLNF